MRIQQIIYAASVFGLVTNLSICNEPAMTPAPSKWMSALPDTKAIASLTIPGTHNSCALYEPVKGTAACQHLSIEKQLESGVRFFDVRCRHEGDLFSIYHGPVFQKQDFTGVVDRMKRFLNRNPSETLLVSVKEEHRPRNNSRSFEDTFRSLVEGDSVWWLGEDLPTLGDVRGKIVLLRRFNSSQSLGIDATNWGHDGFFQGRQLFIQDRFELPNAALKWKIIERSLKHAGESDSNRRVHLNYCSGYVKNLLGLPSITEISTPINKKLLQYLAATKHRRLGCVVVDFTTPDIALATYQLNFPSIRER